MQEDEAAGQACIFRPSNFELQVYQDLIQRVFGVTSSYSSRTKVME
jgi:hypothetical protein